MGVKRDSVTETSTSATEAGFLPVSNDVSLIRTVEELLPVLLSINTAIATIRERKELFTAILELIKPFIPVDDTGILVLDETGTRWQDWTNADNYQNHPASAQLQQLGYDKFQPLDRWLEYTSNHSGIMTVARFREQYPEHPFGAVMWEAGLKEFIFTPLVNGGKKLGVLFFDAETEGTYTEGHFPLFEAIANQLAIAVANILANEAILERERETRVLLGISESIASIHGMAELLQVIHQKIKPLFGFDSPGLFIVNQEENYSCDLTVLTPGITNDAINLKAAAVDLPEKVPYRGSNVEQVMQLEGAHLWNWKEAYQQSGMGHPYLPICFEHGLVYAIVCPLKVGGTKIGFICLNATEDRFTPKQLPFFAAIADQVAVAVANILANEEILEREREKATLLSISEQLATIRDKHDLFTVIFEKLKPVFGFDEAVVVLCDEERQYTRHLHTATNASAKQNEHYQFIMSERVPVAGTPYEEFLFNEVPKIYSYQYLSGQYPHHVGVKILKDFGLLESVFMPLRYGGKVLGTFEFHTAKQGRFSESQMPLFRNVADQVAVAVANILANEEILAREREKALLLSLSEDMATIRDREDLWRVMMEKIRPLVDFDDAVVVVFNPRQHSYNHFLTMATEERKANSYYANVVRQELPLGGSAIQALASQQEEVYYWSVGEYLERYPGYPGFLLMQQTNLHHSIAVKLRWGGDLLGLFLLHYNSKQPIQQAKYSLYKSIADQVAVAVANILANEEILEREREKALLLSLSEDMATIRDRDDLWKVMMEKIRPLVGFDDAVAVNFTSDFTQVNHLLTVSPKERQNSPYYTRLVNQYTPVAGTPWEWILTLEDSHFWDNNELYLRYPDYPGVLIMRETGLNYAYGFKLRWAGQVIGILNFFFNEQPVKAQVNLYKSISDQVAVAVANILANEEILQREREKALLLSLSEDMATIRDQDDLWRVMMEKIKPLVGFDDAVLLILTEDLTEYSFVLTMSPTERQAHALYPRVVGNNQVANSPVPWYLKQSTDLFVQDLQALEADPTFPGNDPAVQMMKETGLWCSVVQKLRWSGRLMGVLAFHFGRPDQIQQPKYNLYKAIADQLSVAVANILANEEILKQKADIEGREREKSLQITLTSALTRETAWEQKLLKAVEALQPFVPFDYAVVGMEKDGQPGRGYGYRRIGFDEYQTISTEDFLRMSGLTPEKYAKLRAEVVYKEPLLLNGKDLEAFCRRPGLKRLVTGMFNLQSNLVLPLPLSRDGQFVLSLFSKHPDTYRPHHLELLSRLEGPLAVTLDKLLAYEEIEKLSERLKEENTYLLEEVRTNYNFEEIIGTSKALHEALAKVVQVAPTDATVLIGGETGTGKELVARAIHNLSGRRHKLLVKLNCACLPAQLIESELFGHERGAFTGAHDRRIGKFELAHGGTIFLDEIGEMPPELQVKLLRVLQEKEIERLGGKGPIRTDVRVIAATNRDLEKEVIAGRFRADLYFRLNVFPVTLPPLRERREDIPLLATHFLGKCNKKMGKHLSQLSGTALQEMMTYHWPGNIRELEHVIEQSVITSTGKSLELARPLRLTKASIFPLEELGQSPLKSLADNEREHILRVLRLTEGRIRGAGGAAEILDIIPTTLEGRMRKLGIKKEHVFKKAK